MREIRFRAKRQDNGEWIKSGTIIRIDTGASTTIYMPSAGRSCDLVVDSDGNLNVLDATFYQVQADTIGQFIGDQDAGGQDIYEGDIVKHGDKVYMIRYFDRYARFAGKNKNCVFAVFSFGNCTIIGNIHDSPNLMEAVK